MSARAAALAGPGTPGPARGERAERALWVAVGIGVAVVLAAAVLRVQANPILAAVVLPLALIAYQRTVLAWQTLLGLTLLVILFIPIRRYTVGGGLPVELEPYRLLARGRARVLAVRGLRRPARCAGGGRASRRRSSLVIAAILGSLALNVSARQRGQRLVLKQVTFFLSFFLIVYFVASVVERGPKLDRMLRLLVGGGTLLAVLSLVEWRTGTNFFNGLHHVIPFLHYVDFGDHIARGTGFRALGVGPAPDRARRGARDAHPAHRLPAPPRRPLRLARVRGPAHARRVRHRLADRGDHADRPARHLPGGSSARRPCGCCRC